MSREALQALTYQECAYMHSLMSSPIPCTLEALKESYDRILRLFDLLSHVTNEDDVEKLIVLLYHQTFKRGEKEDGR